MFEWSSREIMFIVLVTDIPHTLQTCEITIHEIIT